MESIQTLPLLSLNYLIAPFIVVIISSVDEFRVISGTICISNVQCTQTDIIYLLPLKSEKHQFQIITKTIN